MKYTTLSILSTSQVELLEKLIIKHGQIVTSQDIFAETETKAKGNWKRQQTKNLITKLVKNGWLVRIKKGLYAISDLSSRGFLSLSPNVVAGLLAKNSYVSFESALQYHGMFDQSIKKTVSVSLKKFKNTSLNNMEYEFIKTKKEFFFGWQKITIDNRTINMATAEKALIDMVNFHRSEYVVDLVIEKIKEHKNDLDFARLTKYLQNFSETTIKTFGFIFDLLGIDSNSVYNLIKKSIKTKRGTHRMLTGDKNFNAKWRLYYDGYFDKYKSD